MNDVPPPPETSTVPALSDSSGFVPDTGSLPQEVPESIKTPASAIFVQFFNIYSLFFYDSD
jgi:hypothetical protein